jgi:hypothetical protein
MSFKHVLASAAVLFCCAAPAAAQAVKLEFHDGRVNLSAQNASVRAILNEWARLGGTKIVNAERVQGGGVTLELNGVPERQALDIVLRTASGYLAGPRAAGAAGPSQYASILILPTSTAPRPVAGPTPPNPGQPVFVPGQPQPFNPAAQVMRGQPGPEDDDTIVEPPDPDDPPDAVRPRAPRNFVPPNRAGAVVRPFPAPDLENDVQPEPPAPVPVATPSVPANPFGVSLGSSRPGVITPVPQQPQQRPTVDPEP